MTANSGTARTIIDALGIEADEQELASLLTRANRAYAIANHDDYHNQCASIRALLAPDPRIAAADAMAKALEAFLEAWDKSHQLEKTDVARTMAESTLAAYNALK